MQVSKVDGESRVKIHLLSRVEIEASHEITGLSDNSIVAARIWYQNPPGLQKGISLGFGSTSADDERLTIEALFDDRRSNEEIAVTLR